MSVMMDNQWAGGPVAGDDAGEDGDGDHGGSNQQGGVCCFCCCCLLYEWTGGGPVADLKRCST